MKNHIVTINLTPEQIELLDPVMAIAEIAANRGMPGMVMAQIAGGQMRAGFVPAERARKVALMDGTGSPVTLTDFD